MFIKKREFTVKNEHSVEFIKLLGEFGLRFRIGDKRNVDDWDGNPVSTFRVFSVYGTKHKLAKIDYVLHILALLNYNLF